MLFHLCGQVPNLCSKINKLHNNQLEVDTQDATQSNKVWRVADIYVISEESCNL